MKRVRNFFTQNILWKLVSLMLSIILWIIAINVQDPWSTSSFGSELEIRNLDLLKDNDLVLLNEEQLLNRNINVRVRARRSGLSNISQEGITTYIDMSDINFYNESITNTPLTTDVNLDINTSLSRNEYEGSTRPVSVPVVLDRIITTEMPISIEKVNSVGSNFVSLTPTINPSTVMVTGPQSLIEDIEEIVAIIDLQGATNNITEMVAPIIYNHNRRDITDNFELNVSEVEVSVPINVYRAIPVNDPTIVGNVASGHNIIGVYYTPQVIEVVGSADDIFTINSLNIGNIDVTGATSDISVVVDMESQLIGSNLSIRNGTPHDVTVTVSISDDFVTDLSVPITQFTIEGDITNLELESHIELSLMGDKFVLENITYEDIWGHINVEGLGPGEHDVIVNAILPQGVTNIGGNIFTKVIVYDEEVPDDIYSHEEGDVNIMEEEHEDYTQE